MTIAKRMLLWVLIPLVPLTAFAAGNLYGPMGVVPQAVRQGNQGSCYFHASIASLASTHPDLLRAAIRQDAKGNLSVRFADGSTETVYAEDVQFSRSSGYDRSDGLWVAVLFRAYAQRTLRAALMKAVDASTLFVSLKLWARGIVANSDLLLLAYDRAIRSQIDQAGTIDRNHLKMHLQQELKSVPVDDKWKQQAVDLVDSSGFFDSLAAEVKANGELFGAYRAVGQGGLPARVLAAFEGTSKSYRVGSDQATANALATALRGRQPVVAWTGPSEALSLVAKSRLALNGAQNWYVPTHAYSVLAVNPDAGTVTVRNPWGTHPDPGGEFTLPLGAFTTAYVAFSTSTESAAQGAGGGQK